MSANVETRSGARRAGAAEARAWRLGSAGVGAALVLLLLVNVAMGDLRPSAGFGLAYGVLAAVAMLGAAALAVRRRTMRLSTRLGLGRTRAWLYFHLYGGTLFALLVLMHTGFQLPAGVLGWWLWLLSLWTVLTGFLGLALQQWIPKALGSGLGLEVHYDRIPELVAELRDRAEELASTASEPVRQLHQRQVAPELAAPTRRWRYFIDPTGSIHARLRAFEYLRGLLGGDDRDGVTELEALLRAKLEMDAHYTLQWALRSWLYLHVPTSLVLVVLVVVHVGTIVYY